VINADERVFQQIWIEKTTWKNLAYIREFNSTHLPLSNSVDSLGGNTTKLPSHCALILCAGYKERRVLLMHCETCKSLFYWAIFSFYAAGLFTPELNELFWLRWHRDLFLYFTQVAHLYALEWTNPWIKDVTWEESS